MRMKEHTNIQSTDAPSATPAIIGAQNEMLGKDVHLPQVSNELSG